MSVMRVGDDPNTVLPLSPELELLRSYWALNHAVERTSKRMSARLGVTAEQPKLRPLIVTDPPEVTPAFGGPLVLTHGAGTHTMHDANYR